MGNGIFSQIKVIRFSMKLVGAASISNSQKLSHSWIKKMELLYLSLQGML